MRSMYDRNLDMSYFGQWIDLLQWPASSFGVPKCPVDHQYILRMMVRSPETKGWVIPDELEWVRESIFATARNLSSFTSRYDYPRGVGPEAHTLRPYVYITVRHGLVESTTDDQWHVDGFSMRTPHVPEINYVWSDRFPTQYVSQAFDIPPGFDPMKHNLHTLLAERVNPKAVRSVKLGNWAVFHPYIVHRRDPASTGLMRSMVRISYLPVEIEDDTCTRNPLLPSKRYGRTDIRSRLTRYVPVRQP